MGRHFRRGEGGMASCHVVVLRVSTTGGTIGWYEAGVVAVVGNQDAGCFRAHRDSSGAIYGSFTRRAMEIMRT